MALHYRQIDIAKMMIEDYKADVNFLTYQTALHEALWGDTKLLEYMLKRGASPNYKNEVGDSPFTIICATREWPQAVTLMVGYNGHINIRDSKFRTPLHNSAAMGFLGNLSELIRYHAKLDLRDEDGNTALHLAVKNGNLQAAAMLINAGARTDIRNNQNQTVFDLAERNSNYTSVYVKVLVAQSAQRRDSQKVQEITQALRSSKIKVIHPV